MLELEVLYIEKNANNELDINYFDSKNEPLIFMFQRMLKKLKVQFPKYSSLYVIFYESLTEEEKLKIRSENGEGREYYFKETKMEELKSKKNLDFLKETLNTLLKGIRHSIFRECITDDELNKIENYVYEQNFIFVQNIGRKNNKTKTMRATLKAKLTPVNLNLFLVITDMKSRKSLYDGCVFELPQSVIIPLRSKLNPISLYGYELYWENESTIDIIINTVGDRLRTKIYRKNDDSVLIKQQKIKA
ncbi:hypothetical protein ACHFI2_07860 [Exiguobacterium acetylicum]|uniref:hypothetical protein n=1 Tax=Exiguobacterium acetylicum TaxID=41170 RepID=UPI00387687EE